MTIEEFLLKAKDVHDNKFLYPNLTFKTKKDKIEIICSENHTFFQSVHCHLDRRQGCPDCHPRAPITLESFIDRTKTFNIGQYDYSLITDFKSGQDTIRIKCTVDNTIFTQSALNHLKSPKQCPMCKKNQQKEKALQSKRPRKRKARTNEQFILKSQEKYKDLFDYSLTNYKNKRTEVCLKCKKNNHIFWQTPASHLRGHGCPKCIGAGQYSQEDFLFKARLVHGDKYDLSNTIYTASCENIIVKCPKHNDFEIQAARFLRGQGCRRCNSDIFVETQDEFIAKAKEVHLDRFDLSQIKFIKSTGMVTPICKKHGMFNIQSCKFLSGRGCQMCAISKGERLIENFLKKHNVLYKHEKRFFDCRGKQPLKFDFYLPEYKACIEYDGVGHYSSQVYGKESFESTVKHDQIKDKYCLNNTITLIRINSFKLIPILLTELIYPITI